MKLDGEMMMNDKFKYKTFTIRVQEDLLQVFAECCAKNSMSMSAVMRQLMESYVTGNKYVL